MSHPPSYLEQPSQESRSAAILRQGLLDVLSPDPSSFGEPRMPPGFRPSEDDYRNLTCKMCSLPGRPDDEITDFQFEWKSQLSRAHPSSLYRAVSHLRARNDIRKEAEAAVSRRASESYCPQPFRGIVDLYADSLHGALASAVRVGEDDPSANSVSSILLTELKVGFGYCVNKWVGLKTARTVHRKVHGSHCNVPDCNMCLYEESPASLGPMEGQDEAGGTHDQPTYDCQLLVGTYAPTEYKVAHS